MGGGVSASPQTSVYSRIPPKTQRTSRGCHQPRNSSATFLPPSSLDHPLCSSSYFNLKPTHFGARRISLRCNSSTRPGGPPPGDSDNRSILDAFFLGKALAEALNERIQSTAGEFLSTIGRLQAEQQKQVQDFQEEVLERAKRAKEKAAREAIEVQGLIPNSSTANISTVTNGVTSTTVSSATDVPELSPAPPNSSVIAADKDENPTNTDPLSEVSNED